MHRESRLHASNGKAGKNNYAVLPRLDSNRSTIFVFVVVVAIYSYLLNKLTERYRAFLAECTHRLPRYSRFIHHRNNWEHFAVM